jgi:hypothetical protein
MGRAAHIGLFTVTELKNKWNEQTYSTWFLATDPLHSPANSLSLKIPLFSQTLNLVMLTAVLDQELYRDRFSLKLVARVCE